MEEVNQKNKRSYCIIVPVYKKELTELEKISLTSLCRETNNYLHTYLICPKNLNIDAYTAIFPAIKKLEFPEVFFTNKYTYSILLLQFDFYNIFSSYDYMFIFQLDGYMFKDEIQKWVDKDIDYVGAPVLSEKSKMWLLGDAGIKNPWVGNGGVSLRRIKTFKYLSDPNAKFRIINTLTDNVLFSYFKGEDTYFANVVPELYGFKIKKAQWTEALEFSWDLFDFSVDIEELLKKSNVKIDPMCCHGWNISKTALKYWQHRINEITNDIINNSNLPEVID